jgi:alkylation response protein AidB-like acyl-CoA dehydrogenase
VTPTRTGTADRAAALDEAMDTALGGPEDAAPRIARLDEAEEFPAELCAALDAFGLPTYYVPPRYGGALDDHEELLHLWRTVARRDVSVVVAHAKTYLGAVCVWIAGSSEQTAATAAAVLAGTPVAWALTEPEHGADLLNNELTATAHADGYRLDGAKWPINNATRAGRLTLLARTGPAGSPRGHSLFVVDKAVLEPGTWRTLPKARTHGIRGIDISGIAFDGATLPRQALLGPEGTGVETVLRGLQLTRTMCAALSLGAGEHGLRLAARFTATRVIQKRPLAERPHPAAILARCGALLAATEAAALVAARSIHSLTRELSTTAATVKALAPTLVDASLGELAELLGARSFLTDVHEHGAFQKTVRDHQIVAVFDGSTPVNRAALAQQFPALVRGYAAATTDTEGLAEAVDAARPPRPLEYDALTLASRRGNSVVQSLPALAAALQSRPTPTGLAEHAAALTAATGDLHTRMAALRPAARPPMAAYELAAAYELCYAGAACLHLWAAREADHAGDPLWADGLWARAALRALRERLAVVLRTPTPDPAPGDEHLDQTLARVLTDAAETGAPVTPFGAPAPRPAEAEAA